MKGGHDVCRITRQAVGVPDRRLLGDCGAILGLVGNLIHPATSGPGDPEGTARVVAESQIWVPLHLVLATAFVLMLGGLVAVHDSIAGGLPAALARYGWS
jgi:hypothetical protein